MRPIKFRAWHKEKKVMANVAWIDFRNQGAQFGYKGLTYKFPLEIILMQFTGLKDKNGKGDEVYKDDVVSSFNGVKYHVYWDTEYGQWWARIVNKTKGKYTQPLCEILDNSYMHIIGNIHQNPELMEQNNGCK